MTDGYKPEEDKRWRNKDHPYWNAECRCRHPRREHDPDVCAMAGCYCKRFIVYYDDPTFRQELPFSYA